LAHLRATMVRVADDEPIQRDTIFRIQGFPKPQAVPAPDEWMRRVGALPTSRSAG
jgi:hypothetical protein